MLTDPVSTLSFPECLHAFACESQQKESLVLLFSENEPGKQCDALISKTYALISRKFKVVLL